jgi:hypothetical protein
MSRRSCLSTLAGSALILLVTFPGAGNAQQSAVPRHPPHPEPAVTVRGQVFIGGYFYDPFFGPYPWWHGNAYPSWYFPVFDNRADVRLQVTPEAAEDAAVYVDGFYAGVVDDFNGVFQALPLTPGGHGIVLYLEGYRTVRRSIYLRPGSTFTLRETLERLPASELSEPPHVAPAVPPPPPGTFQSPVTPPRVPRAATAPPATPAAAFGTLDLFVQPPGAEVVIDGQRWASSEEGHFLIRLPVGKHHVEVTQAGYRFATDIAIREGEASLMNLRLTAGTQ